MPEKTVPQDLNSDRPVVLTPVIVKCPEKLVSYDIKCNHLASFDYHQFAYWSNGSTVDAITYVITTHTVALSHQEHRNTYVRMLFVDYSSAFNTIIPDILTNKMPHSDLSTYIWSSIRDLFTNHFQVVRLGPHLSPPSHSAWRATRLCSQPSAIYLSNYDRCWALKIKIKWCDYQLLIPKSYCVTNSIIAMEKYFVTQHSNSECFYYVLSIV